MFDIAKNAELAKQAALVVAQLSSDQKNGLLLKMADAIVDNCAEIITENAKDIVAGKEKGLTSAMLDRLLLTEQ